jgi:hypothetical protein
VTSPVLGCFHCEGTDHWQDNCPLLVPPDDKKHHEQRIAEYKRQFDYEEIGPKLKTRLIETENKLWAKRQKELARK